MAKFKEFELLEEGNITYIYLTQNPCRHTINQINDILDTLEFYPNQFIEVMYGERVYFEISNGRAERVSNANCVARWIAQYERRCA